MTRFDPQPDEPTRPNRFAMSIADPPPIQTKITNHHCQPTTNPNENHKPPLLTHTKTHEVAAQRPQEPTPTHTETQQH